MTPPTGYVMRTKYKQQGLGRTRVAGFDSVRYAPHAMRLTVLKRDDYCCRYCGRAVTLESANIDHVIAWKRHGATAVTNLVTSCSQCNQAKKNSHVARPRHLGKKPSDPFKITQTHPYVERDYVVVPEYQAPCGHRQSPNCLRQRCLMQRGIPYDVP